jgi:beta-N-acetylhexosaminidase
MTEFGQTAAIFGCEAATLAANEASFFAECQPFGFILFARNVQTPDQLRRLTGDLRSCLGRDVPILVDQEGGRVQRLRAPHWREWTPPLDFVQAAGPNAVLAMELRYRLIAKELLSVGINGNCAPSGDLAGPLTHPFLKNRCYGSDPALVAQIALAVARGLLAEGVWPVVKHLPGHGRSENDTHLDLPTVSADRATLNATDFGPFKALADLPFAMTAHIIFTAYDSRPATQSPAMIRAIREEIGFRGLLMTDDLNMQALTGSLYERTALSMAAGCDLALHCKGDLAEMQSVAMAAGPLRTDAVARAQKCLAALPKADAIDTAALDAQLDALINGQAGHG